MKKILFLTSIEWGAKKWSRKMRLFAFSIKHIFSSYCVHVFSFYNIKHHNGVTDHKTLMSLLNIKHHSCITNWLTAPLKILFLLIIMNLACRSCQPVRVAIRPAFLKTESIINYKIDKHLWIHLIWFEIAYDSFLFLS